ncbi:MAG: LuxR C-terminal-related transcriptional regulator [Aeromicrobium sp.]
MDIGDAPPSDTIDAPSLPRPDSLLEARLHRPSRRDDWVRRERLLAAMAHVCERPVTLVAAPAGYGKTTLVAQWLDDIRPVAAWVSLDAGDNDPSQLWTDIATSLERAGCALPSRPRRRTAPWSRAPASMLALVTEALTAMTTDIVLVLDDFDLIQDVTCHDQIELLIEHLPPQAHLVLITRADPGLRLGRLRVSGQLVELRAHDLGFTTAEATDLLSRERIDLDEGSIDLLVQRTEGWPAGLYLAILSMAGRSDPAAFVHSFSGGNRFIGDYLTEEVLSRHPDDVREFITTISILDRFSADLCDHVADVTGSAGVLHELEVDNLFLMGLDGERAWYRFHHLFASVARGELELRHPDRVATLHERAACWFRDNGYVDEAIKHSIAADRTDIAIELIQQKWLQYVDAGRIATVLGWVEAIGRQPGAAEPAASVTAAWLAALVGDEDELTARLGSLDAYRDVGPLPDGTRSVESAVSMIQGLFGYGGPVEMMDGAQRAVAIETDQHSPFYALANVSLGHAAYVAGELDRAVVPLANARLNGHAPAIIQALALSTESLVDDELGESDRSRILADQAMWVLDDHNLRAVPQASLAYTALGAAQAAAGDTDVALSTLARGLVLRRESTAHGPWGMIHHLLVNARVAAQAGRHGLAQELLTELEARLGTYSDGMRAMNARLASVRRLVRADLTTEIRGEPLTGRELDILRLLQGTLSLHEIAAELYLSFNTVKTHTRAVYRKLGVHTRADAVRIGRQRLLI